MTYNKIYINMNVTHLHIINAHMPYLLTQAVKFLFYQGNFKTCIVEECTILIYDSGKGNL